MARKAKAKQGRLDGMEPESIREIDDLGVVVPARLTQVFMTLPLYSLFAQRLSALATLAQKIQSGASREGKPLDGRPYQRFYTVFKEARARFKDLRPSLVCPKCEGEGCTMCVDKGWLTFEEAKNAKLLPSR